MIRVTDQISIAEWELSESFSRASGPGGKNVNKVETAVTLARANTRGCGWCLNVAFWHIADVRWLPGLGPLTGALPTFGAECRVIGAFQTLRRGVVKVGS